jgi:hypothetical protein
LLTLLTHAAYSRGLDQFGIKGLDAVLLTHDHADAVLGTEHGTRRGCGRGEGGFPPGCVNFPTPAAHRVHLPPGLDDLRDVQHYHYEKNEATGEVTWVVDCPLQVFCSDETFRRLNREPRPPSVPLWLPRT